MDRKSTPSLKDVLEVNPSLQSVLDHYKNDTLKYKAAVFLIENLPYHYGYEGEALVNYKKLFELHGQRTMYPEKVLDSIKRKCGDFRLNELKLISDIYIKPDFLIENIDLAFKVWREQPWGKHISFDDFCEYVLPYRVADEKLESWRKQVYEKYNPVLDSIRSLPEAEDPLYVARFLMDVLHRGPINFTGLFSFGPHYGYKVVEWRSGSCKDFTCLQLYVFRALGIPCSEEKMLIRGNGNVAHYWNAIFDKKGNTYYCSILDPTSELKDPTTMWDPKGKVYRTTFSVNKKVIKQIGEKNIDDVYPFFRHPCMVDVTAVYSGKRNWQVNIPPEKIYNNLKTGELVYLCVSSYLKWIPLAWCHSDEKGACYNDVEGQVIFRLATFNKGELQLQSDPFLLERETGKIRFYPTNGTLTEVKLLHKYDLYFEPFIRNMIGGVFEGSNDLQFRKRDTLHLIMSMPTRLRNVVNIKGNKKYRYVRFWGANGSHCNIAEVAFFESLTDSVSMKGKIMGTSGSRGIGNICEYKNVFDGDPYTSFDFTEPSGGWAGLDLGNSRLVEKIVFTPRNRDNFIRAGDLYELFYCGNQGWQSVGHTHSTSDSLIYKVPNGSLLYLKDHTRGKDERVFECVNGKQYFW